MTTDIQELVKHLLRGDCYLVKHDVTNNKKAFKLMKGHAMPMRYISRTAYKKYEVLFKTDRHDRITLNLSLVRKESGKSFIKQQYLFNYKQRQLLWHSK